jgi:hypothetical protein
MTKMGSFKAAAALVAETSDSSRLGPRPVADAMAPCHLEEDVRPMAACSLVGSASGESAHCGLFGGLNLLSIRGCPMSSAEDRNPL